MVKKYVPTAVYFTDDPALAQLYASPYRECRRDLRLIGYPRFLYKYRALDVNNQVSIDRLRDLLIDSDLWLSLPNDFNDPFDMKAVVTMSGTKQEREAGWDRMFAPFNDSQKNKRDRIRELLSDDAMALGRLQHSFQTNLQRAGVSCFSTDGRSIHMWSHYADSHKGIAIQFEPAKFASVFSQPVKVDYPIERPTIDWLKSNSPKPILLSKHKSWEYEHEWRLILPEMAGYYFSFRPKALTGIILGCKVEPKTEDAINQMLVERKYKNLPGVALYRATQHTSKYKLLVLRT